MGQRNSANYPKSNHVFIEPHLRRSNNGCKICGYDRSIVELSNDLYQLDQATHLITENVSVLKEVFMLMDYNGKWVGYDDECTFINPDNNPAINYSTKTIQWLREEANKRNLIMPIFGSGKNKKLTKIDWMELLKSNELPCYMHCALYYCQDCVKNAIILHQTKLFGLSDVSMLMSNYKYIFTFDILKELHQYILEFVINIYKIERVNLMMTRITGKY